MEMILSWCAGFGCRIYTHTERRHRVTATAAIENTITGKMCVCVIANRTKRPPLPLRPMRPTLNSHSSARDARTTHKKTNYSHLNAGDALGLVTAHLCVRVCVAATASYCAQCPRPAHASHSVPINFSNGKTRRKSLNDQTSAHSTFPPPPHNPHSAVIKAT